MGDMLTILKLTKEPLVSLLTAKLPQFNSEMTPQQFWKFRIDWDMFTKMTNLSIMQTKIQLYNCTDEAIQNFIINTYPEFFNTNPNKLLDMLELIQKLNPMVRRNLFSSIVQNDNESVQNYLILVQSGERDCNFICPNCNHNLSSIYIKNQIIRSIANNAL